MSLVNSSGVTALLHPVWTPPDEFDEFRIVRALGAGAMGQVYLAQDRLLDRPVALKFVHLGADPAARARVLDEARAIARLQHPNVVAIYRVAEYAGRPYLVSEYVQGRALNDLERPMPWRKALDIALDLARGLAAAHRRGVLHRDVKPANAVLTDEGQAKLLDFGLATIFEAGSAEDLAITQSTALPGEPHGKLVAVDLAALMNGATAPLQSAEATSAVVDEPGLLPQPIGTPIYMAPEIWRGESATRRSDLYSLGVLLYELLTGTAPHRDVALADLAAAVQARDIPRLGGVVPGIEPALAAIVDRLIERDPRARFPSADALLAALEQCAAPPVVQAHPSGNPYRGLAAFASAHAPLFFGRGGEIRELVDRVRIEPFVVVGGDSGTGKSSLCRAGVLPWLEEHGGWSCVEVVPGRHPVRALAAALAPWAGAGEAALGNLLRDNPDAVARAIRQRIVGGGAGGAGGAARAGGASPRRLLVFVDQLEELLTLAEAGEARAVAAAVAALAVRSPSVRVLATARSDFLSRLAMLPGLGDEMARGLYFLRPLTGEHVREVIVRPAAAAGVAFESEALVDTLVAQTEGAPGGLPLLQFTLAELWDARDTGARRIRAESLTALGGVGGSLTRHADRLLAGLRANEREAARRIVLRLVTAQGTRTRRPKDELVTGGAERDAEHAALEALVRGRVLVANNALDGAYEIAHEALLTSWSTLQGWLQRDAANRELEERVEQAAAAWERMDRGRDLLWGRRQLAEARGLDRAALAPREAAFLAGSARALRVRRRLGAGIAAALVVGAVSVGLAVRARARRALDAMVEDRARAAATAQRDAQRTAARRDSVQDRALALFDAHRWRDGEDAWTEVETLGQREEEQYRSASAYLESVLLLDPARRAPRAWLFDLTLERLTRAERNRHRDLTDELASRLPTYDPARAQAALASVAHLALSVAPAGTTVWIERPDAPRELVGKAPLPPLTVPAQATVLVFEAPGRAAARLPILPARGETLRLGVALPTVEAAPPGMIYVPAGRFLFGSADGSDIRRGFLNAAPLHEVWTGDYFIARHEVTFGEWIEFLDELPADERRARSPQVGTQSTVALTEIGPRRWRLAMTPTTRTYTAETGQRLHYEARTLRADQDWLRFPVSAVSYQDAIAYARWLDRTGRVPGARLCNEYEWERAARGADGRVFPSGARLAPDDANLDVTYGRQPLAFGPDEVGAHPGSRSPVGADDMAGNVWEWARSEETPDAPVLRGGSWYGGSSGARSMNREYSEPTLRHLATGIRLCATPR